MSAEPESDFLDTASISSRQEFILFLNNLLTDYQHNGQGWENRKLVDFLEALASYAEDIDGYYLNLAQGLSSLPPSEKVIDANSASWRVFADMLRGATMYE